jgi:hypothetical protein
MVLHVAWRPELQANFAPCRSVHYLSMIGIMPSSVPVKPDAILM